MFSIRKCLLAAGMAVVLAGSPASLAFVAAPAAASEIKLVVNKVPITTYDIQRRAAFLKLQNRKGNLNALAEEDMINQALRAAEMKRLGVRVSEDQVSDAYARFGKSNKLSTAQLDQIMQQSGVTKAHFKEFIRTQMGWNSVMAAKSRAPGGGMTEQDVVRRMLEKGGAKPTATEYMLQQVIFVVPASERGKLGARKREAEAMRQRFAGCERTREFAKGLMDVTVRDLGRKFGPELPQDWADQIKETKVGSATAVRETDRGIEFIGICSSREVSDDRVAQMVFQSEALGGGGGGGGDNANDPSTKYLAELREKAQIKRH